MNKSGRKASKIWVDKGSEFYDRSMKQQLQDNDMEMYWTHNEGKLAATEAFIRILKDEIYKYMTSLSKKCVINTTIHIIAQSK